jgi:hypothetical protein
MGYPNGNRTLATKISYYNDGDGPDDNLMAEGIYYHHTYDYGYFLRVFLVTI